MSPTALSMRLLRDSGYTPAVVERWLPEVKQKRDLYGIGDVLGIAGHREPRFLLIQATSMAHVGDRLKKARSKPGLRTWLNAGGSFQVWGWAKRGDRWAVKRIEVHPGDLADVLIEAPQRRQRRAATPDMFAKTLESKT